MSSLLKSLEKKAMERIGPIQRQMTEMTSLLEDILKELRKTNRLLKKYLEGR